jgi:hypothetical protein
MDKYTYTWRTNPIITFIALPIAAGLAWGALTMTEAPVVIVVVLWGIVVVTSLVALGSLLRTTVTVDAEGHFTMEKTLAGFRFASIHIPSDEIQEVELTRTMTPGLERASDSGSSSPDKPRYRLDLVHKHGKHLVEATATFGTLSSEAHRLAAALNRPLQKTGDWSS